MFPLRLFAVLIVGLAMLPFASAQDPATKVDKDDHPTKLLEDRRDFTHLRRVTEETFLHEAARVSFTVPKGWKEIRPHRLERKIDPDLFCSTYPDEAALCVQPLAAQLRKHVYPTRSYWSEGPPSSRESTPERPA